MRVCDEMQELNKDILSFKSPHVRIKIMYLCINFQGFVS